MKSVVFIFFLLTVSSADTLSGQVQNDTLRNDTLIQWNHPYHQTLVMKMLISVPDGDSGTIVYTDLEKALVLIKQVDNLTLHVPKIIYLVGWQYNGHDDKYPAFFEVNKALKRPEDADARASLIWLMTEAEKYHTTVSLHINMTDAYEDSPLWMEYKAQDLISKNADGSLMVIGNYNKRKAYQVNYRNEWEKGYAQKRIDALVSLLPPLKDAGTIHIDAWIARESKGHAESAMMEAEYQKKVCRYWQQLGIEPTGEWVLDYMTGLIPFAWHFNARTQDDYLRVPARVYTGSHMNPDLRYSDFDLEFLFGTSMYGENIFPNKRNHIPDDAWEALFAKEFYLDFVQYYYLNSLERLKVTGEKKNRVAYFSNNVLVSIADSSVLQNNRRLRSGDNICFPALWRNDNSLVAYSKKGIDLNYALPPSWKKVIRADIFMVSKNGLTKKSSIKITNNQLQLTLIASQPLLIEPVKER